MTRKSIYAVLISVVLSVFCPVYAADTPFEFNNPEQEERYKNLIKEIRCLVCQNQSLEDSHAPLAQDLRQEIYDMIVAEQNKDEIIDFLVSRYGDFVLFRPPVNTGTLILWFGPFLLLVAVIFFILRFKQKHGVQPAEALSPEEQRRLEQLLHTDNEEGQQ